MPVYDRRYRGWDGELRSPRSAVWTIAREGLGRVFASRLNLILFVVAALPFLFFAGAIYLANNLDLLAQIGMRDPEAFRASVDGAIFFWFLVVESSLGFLLAAFVGPTLIAPDLANGALPLYLARPIQRRDYILGKLLVLLAMLSGLTWVPGLLLVGLEASLAGGGWLLGHLRLPLAIFLGSWIWILMISLVALAISAWVRWRPLATAMMFIVFMVGEGFGRAINAFLDTRWGKLFILDDLVESIWDELFGGVSLLGREMVRDPLPISVAVTVIAVTVVLAYLLLRSRVRAFEVVR